MFDMENMIEQFWGLYTHLPIIWTTDKLKLNLKSWIYEIWLYIY